jgi:hypothetical protein
VNPTTPPTRGNAAAKGGEKYGKKKQQPTPSSMPKTQKPTPPPTSKPTQEECIKGLLHQVDAASHPGDCTYHHYFHNVLKNSGKLSKTDKESVRSYIDGMTPGPYADKCKLTFDIYL